MAGRLPGVKTSYNKQVVDKICELIAGKDNNIRDICKAANIHPDTYYMWIKDIPEFKARIQAAHRQRFSSYVKAARKGLYTLLNGREYEETTATYYVPKKGRDKGKKVLIGYKTVTKVMLPNVTSVIFTLKTLDPENFEQIQRTILQNPDGSPLEAPEMKIIHIASKIPLANDEDQVLIGNE